MTKLEELIVSLLDSRKWDSVILANVLWDFNPGNTQTLSHYYNIGHCIYYKTWCVFSCNSPVLKGFERGDLYGDVPF